MFHIKVDESGPLLSELILVSNDLPKATTLLYAFWVAAYRRFDSLIEDKVY